MSNLDEWLDLLTDEIIVDQQTGVDSWGNPVIVSSEPTNGKITSRSKTGGADYNQSNEQHPDNWSVTVVFPETIPPPSIGNEIKINGERYEIASLTIYDDIDGKVYEASCSNVEDTDPT